MKTKLFTLALVALFGLFYSTDANAQDINKPSSTRPKDNIFVDVYPNPAPDEIHIKTNMPKNLLSPADITIINTNGATMYNYTCQDCGDQFIHTVSVKPWAAGMYYVKLTYKGTVRTARFIKVSE